jgi:hypothetical protein
VNHKHYITCGVNSSLLTLFWFLQKVCVALCVVSQRTLFTRVIYKFTFVSYSSKQQCTGSHHIWRTCTLCPLFGRREKNTDHSGVGLTILLAGACCGDSRVKTFSAAALGLQTNLGVGRSFLFPASSVKFLTRSSLVSRCVYLAPHDIIVSNCWVLLDRENWKSNFMFCLKVRSTHQIAVSHMIRTVDITHVPVVPFHDVRFHTVDAVVTKISFCSWWVHVSLHLNFLSVR